MWWGGGGAGYNHIVVVRFYRGTPIHISQIKLSSKPNELSSLVHTKDVINSPRLSADINTVK